MLIPRSKSLAQSIWDWLTCFCIDMAVDSQTHGMPIQCDLHRQIEETVTRLLHCILQLESTQKLVINPRTQELTFTSNSIGLLDSSK